MNLEIPTTQLLLFVFLLYVVATRGEGIEESRNESANEGVKPVEEFYEESSSEDQFSLQSATTTEPTTTIETYRKLTLSVTDKKNISREFRPSVHLGEIKESRISSGPFNNLHHFKFDSGADPGSYYEHLNDFRFVLQPTAQSLQVDHQGYIHQNLHETVSGSSEEGKKDGTEQNNFVKFQNDVLNVPRYQYGGPSKDQASDQQFGYPAMENVGAQYDLVDQQVFQNLEKPTYEQEAYTLLGKPSKFQSEPHKHEVGNFLKVDPLKTQNYAGFYDHQANQQSSQDYEILKKPGNGVIYVQESSFLKTKKYPYFVHQPVVGNHQIEFHDGGHSNYPVRKRVSPWKKILRLIGAFLPLGLLIAALTPNVVKVDNTTQPSIVLSKWRVTDLPVEHKQARFTDAMNVCEERSICDIILAGGDAGATTLQNILWNLATR
ncbi:hypothetical protein WH47_09216 [Habropoda laboriosa]|uniref:Uncharacterized protein n=2 Tax=Habropoda laboriosa TaxID=597456 RepID=A0A0L7QNL4_9HYME|nr:hypothetical protein WH47_09216 [Habropoda laboriosa]